MTKLLTQSDWWTKLLSFDYGCYLDWLSKFFRFLTQFGRSLWQWFIHDFVVVPAIWLACYVDDGTYLTRTRATDLSFICWYMVGKKSNEFWTCFLSKFRGVLRKFICLMLISDKTDLYWHTNDDDFPHDSVVFPSIFTIYRVLISLKVISWVYVPFKN